MALTLCAGPKLSTSSKAPAIYRSYVSSWAMRTLRACQDFSVWRPTPTHLRSVEHSTFDYGGRAERARSASWAAKSAYSQTVAGQNAPEHSPAGARRRPEQVQQHSVQKSELT